MKSNPFNSPFNVTEEGPTDELMWSRGPGHFAAQGEFGGTVIKLQYSLDYGTTWLDAGDFDNVTKELTANGGFNFNLPDSYVRATLTGGTEIDLSVFILPLSHKR